MKQIESKSQNQMKKNSKLLPILGTVATTGILLASAFDQRLKVQKYQVKSEKIDSPIRIALLTDLHSCDYGTHQSTLIKAVLKENPDVVLLGGDIFDDVLPFERAEEVISQLSLSYPCYYVTGNHEYWSDDVSQILRTIDSYGITILSGTHDIFECHGTPLNICGITDPDVKRIADSYPNTFEQLESLKNVPDNGNFSILLAHRPEKIDFYLDYDFDLMLSGHAHGGQWRIPGLLNGLYSPQQGLFPKFAGGRYEFPDKTFIVSRGLAKETTFVPRIFNRPELVIVDLV